MTWHDLTPRARVLAMVEAEMVGTACPVCWLVHPEGACDR